MKLLYYKKFKWRLRFHNLIEKNYQTNNRFGLFMNIKMQIYLLSIVFVILLLNSAMAQTTGKIAGKVVDSETNEPLIGVNILIEGSTLGAATDVLGEFFILGVPPGNFSLRFQMIGYAPYTITDLRVSVNRTTSLEVKLSPESIKIGEVVITADKISLKKDQTGSIKNISSDQIELLPVENIGDVVNLQAGVVNGHFRGGRFAEVSYMVDGMQVNNAFSNSKTVEVEKEIVADLEVITGTFNAEYGRAMSGIVNVVTKDGDNTFNVSASANTSNYITSNSDIFKGLDASDATRNLDFKIFLSGPILKDNLFFLFNYRKQDFKNHLNAIARFDVDNYSDFSYEDPDTWYTEHTGDDSFVPMNWSEDESISGKLTAPLFSNIKLSLMYTRNDAAWKGYDHSYKYNPYGLATNHKKADLYSVQLSHIISKNFFYELKLSYLDDYYGNYVFENPLDQGYVHDGYSRSTGPGFYTGGQQKNHLVQKEKQINGKLDFSFQLTNNHLIKFGGLITKHQLDNRWHQIKNLYETLPEDENEFYYSVEDGKMIFPNYQPYILFDSTIYADVYHVEPDEFSAYIQDKMEFNELVLNAGLRFDYFNPRAVFPSQRRNPANQLLFPDNPEKVSSYPYAASQTQYSPRLGLAYQLGSAAILRFSYGHFFQMPPMYALYQNSSFRVAPSDYATLMGNSQLNAEKSVQYEIGLWQEVVKNMGAEVSIYYRDIYNLLSTKIISTFNQTEYGLYTNKDYGNVKGLEIKFDYVYSEFYFDLNYTLQFTKGNADNPEQTFTRAGDSMDPIPTLIPMSWDQRHTLNFTLSYSSSAFGVTATSYYNSGVPFTWTPTTENPLANINLYPNNSVIPSSFNVDLYAYWNFLSLDLFKAQLTLNVYNLFDTLNENWVNSETGRAYTGIIRESDITSHHSDFNTYEDRIQNPTMFSAPREIKLGLRILFNY
ncbi:MAG: TonB-dependent receptor [Ignavibacteriaceae bacterium]|nr:TonB-dependent receptor [Ignavibacteriaceae bacterium]